MKTVGDVIERELLVQLSAENFRRAVRGAIRGYYQGDIDGFAFFDRMLSTITRNFEKAWNEGAAACGIKPNERTAEEREALQQRISDTIPQIQKLQSDIEAARERAEAAEEDGEIDLLKSDTKTHFIEVRGDMWANRYPDVVNQAKTLACQNQKLEWELGPTEHCKSCLKMAGKVKRASFWQEAGIRPQHPDLECRGIRCQCTLKPTTKNASPGNLPSIP